MTSTGRTTLSSDMGRSEEIIFAWPDIPNLNNEEYNRKTWLKNTLTTSGRYALKSCPTKNMLDQENKKNRKRVISNDVVPKTRRASIIFIGAIVTWFLDYKTFQTRRKATNPWKWQKKILTGYNLWMCGHSRPQCHEHLANHKTASISGIPIDQTRTSGMLTNLIKIMLLKITMMIQ